MVRGPSPVARATATVSLLWRVQDPRSWTTRPARFGHQGEDWRNNAWSLVVENNGLPNADGQVAGTARFLMPNGPHHWLKRGARFTLFEGEDILADGVVEEVAPRLDIARQTWGGGDQPLFAAALGALREMGAKRKRHWWGVGGSQEITHEEWKTKRGTLILEAETYIGLTVSGPDDLVAELVGLFGAGARCG